MLPEELMWFEDLGLANKEVTSLELRVFFKFSLEKFYKVTNKLRAQTFSSRIFFCFDHVKVGYQIFLQLNHKKGGGKLDFKITVNFVYGSQLLESLVGEAEHVVLLVKLSKQSSGCIFCLFWCNLFVASRFEVVAGGNVCSLVERCTAVDERLKVHI